MVIYVTAPEETKLLVVDYKLEVLCYASKELSIASAISNLLIPALTDQLHAVKTMILPDLLTQQSNVRCKLYLFSFVVDKRKMMHHLWDDGHLRESLTWKSFALNVFGCLLNTFYVADISISFQSSGGITSNNCYIWINLWGNGDEARCAFRRLSFWHKLYIYIGKPNATIYYVVYMLANCCFLKLVFKCLL